MTSKIDYAIDIALDPATAAPLLAHKMVGVAPDNSKEQLSSSKNPMIKYMLKIRENHARSTYPKDYSHVFRKKTRFELFRLSVIAMAIEFAYAAETSFVSPILLQIGLDHKLMTMTWGLSPLIGFFVAPLLGSISDRCKLGWGRRRPIITMLSTGIVAGLILVPYGKELGVLLGDTGYAPILNSTIVPLLNSTIAPFLNSTLAPFSNSTIYNITEGAMDTLVGNEGPRASNFKYAAILTIVGMILLDFDADTCQTPARTYMLDMCIPEDQPKALTQFSLFAGVGGTIGYGIGGIDWENTRIGTFLGGNIPTVFGLVTIIFVVCYFVTVTTFREIPLKLIEKDDMLKPLSATAIKKEFSKNNNPVYYIQETTDLEERMAEKKASNEKFNNIQMDSYQNGHSAISKLGDNKQDAEIEIKASSKALEILEDVEEAVEKPISLKQYLKSIFVMPYSMRMLALTNLFCWMGHVTYCLYFTDFVGEAVFHGDPMGLPNSEAANLYEAGVRFGCWGMSVYAFSCSVYSMSVTKLMRWLGAKTVYITGISYYGIGMLILGIWPTKWGVLFFSTSAGILYGTLFTMPYILVANYHAKNCFRVHNGETIPLKQARGLGTDVAIISSMVFVAQLIVSLSVGPLVAWLETTCAILYASTFLSFLAAICAMFVLYV